MLFELQKGLMVRANLKFNRGEMKKEDFLKEVEVVKELLEEAVEILRVEPEGSKEHAQSVVAKRALANVKEIILFSSFI